MRKVIFIIISVFVLISCKEESTIQVHNMLSKAVIKNVEWGGLPISSQILPGQSSGKITVFEDESYYGINLPESNPIKFYINLNGDLIYVQTKASYRLNVDDDIIIVIEDSTAVFNPLLEKEK